MSTNNSMPDVPPPVQRFVAAINDADTERFVSAFAEDGFVDDWGRKLTGHDGIREWAATDAIGMGAQMTILSAHVNGDTVTTTFAWKSRRFTGESTGIFAVRGDVLAGFTIPPHH
ncbi:nuclear transport factor 2 family protein [Microbacterium koreense]|uniref:Nuclear transport factor 2 family protein n=1 Tax=Microbacterium koreense TaxID=323761 RepID=A0ABW2ZTF1_9MICO